MAEEHDHPESVTWNVGPVRDVVAHTRTDMRKKMPGCGCREFPIIALCHPHSAVYVKYCDIEGVLILSCATCEYFVAKFKVAP